MMGKILVISFFATLFTLVYTESNTPLGVATPCHLVIICSPGYTLEPSDPADCPDGICCQKCVPEGTTSRPTRNAVYCPSIDCAQGYKPHPSDPAQCMVHTCCQHCVPDKSA